MLPMDIVRKFYPLRLKMYQDRKDYLEGKLEAEAKKLSNQARFIMENCFVEFVIGNDNIKIIDELLKRGYEPDPVKAWKAKAHPDDQEESEDASDEEVEVDEYIIYSNSDDEEEESDDEVEESDDEVEESDDEEEESDDEVEESDDEVEESDDETEESNDEEEEQEDTAEEESTATYSSNKIPDDAERAKNKSDVKKFDYLLDLSFVMILSEEEIICQRDSKLAELEALRRKTPIDLWREDVNP